MKQYTLPFAGTTLVEVIVSVAVLALVVPAVLILALGSVSGTTASEHRLQATLLAQQGLEAARSIRDHAWGDLAVGIHGLTDINGYWEWSGDSDSRDGFTRQVTVTDADTRTRDVSATVSWGAGRSVSLSTRLAALRPSLFFQTTQVHFDGGTHSGTATVSVGDGGLALAGGAAAGDFISSAFDTGSDAAAYQTLEWSPAASGTLQFQIRTSSAEAGLIGAVWAGPDGTNGSYYTASGTPIVLDPGASGSRWIQYRVFFDDDDAGVTLEDVSVRYF